MHNNAPCHTATKVTKFLKIKHLSTMKWPAQSLDLNPIENLWTDFKECFPTCCAHLGLKSSTHAEVLKKYADILRELWREQGLQLITKLIESKLRWVAAIITARRSSSYTGDCSNNIHRDCSNMAAVVQQQW